MTTTDNQNPQDFARLAHDSLERIRKLQMQNLDKLARLQVEFMNLCIECNNTQLSRLSEARTPSDMLAVESGVAAEYSAKFFDNARQIMDAANTMQGDLMAWLTDNQLLNELESFVPRAESEKPGQSAKTAGKSS